MTPTRAIAIVLLLSAGAFTGGAIVAATADTLRSEVSFAQGKSSLYTDSPKGEAEIAAFAQGYLQAGIAAEIAVSGGASPEGSARWLTPLAEERARHLADKLVAAGVPRERIVICPSGVDWAQLRDSVKAHPAMPGREAALAALDTIVARAARSSGAEAERLRGPLVAVAGGVPWRYMYRRFFPAMRYARAGFAMTRLDRLASIAPADLATAPPERPAARPSPHFATPESPAPQAARPQYIAWRTNMLHDALLVPNIGFEASLGRRWTVVLDYSAAWWGNRWSSTYNAGRHVWRYEGGNIELRRYFGAAAARKPLTGWHAGAYGQCASYDFQMGDRGYQGRIAWGGGLTAGYQMAVARRWNIDFSLGAGYFGGRYKTCQFADGHNVWVSTRRRTWIGPTRAEVTLVWLWGRANENPGKGGRR